MLRDKDDLVLVEMLRSGKQEALTEIIRRNEVLIASTAKSMLGDTPEAEDVGMEVFIRFYKSASYFKGDSKLSTYLTRIAINLSLNELKKRKRKRSVIQNEEEMEKLADTLTESSDQENAHLKEAIEKAIETLDPNFRSVVTLRLIDGLSTKETAGILNLPIGTVLSRLSRAQKKLQKELEHLRK